VEVDPAEGNDRALALAAWIEARPASICLGKHEAWLERARHLRMLPPGEAVGFTFGDDPSGPTMHFVLIPGDSIKFGYGSSEQEARVRPLLEPLDSGPAKERAQGEGVSIRVRRGDRPRST
jgi:hypothetical protein